MSEWKVGSYVEVNAHNKQIKALTKGKRYKIERATTWLNEIIRFYVTCDDGIVRSYHRQAFFLSHNQEPQ